MGGCEGCEGWCLRGVGWGVSGVGVRGGVCEWGRGKGWRCE